MPNNKNITKVSFIGDIMCEKPFLKSWENQNNKTVFDDLFIHMKDTFSESDYIVGNLETICAGEEFKYTDHIFNFNTPDEFIGAVKRSGIDLVTTATNHSLDRGIEGLIANLEMLDKYSMKSIGTYSTQDKRNAPLIEDVNGLKIGFLNYTYGTNAHVNEVVLKKQELKHICLLKSQEEEIKRIKEKDTPKNIKHKIADILFKFITLEQWIKFKKILRLKYNVPFQDNDLSWIDVSYLEVVKEDIRKAKENSDVVIMCMHSGGQFNTVPGKYTEYMMEFMSENGVDVVVGNHPHVVQKYEEKETGMLSAYSLGNFSISPSSVYVLHEDLPDYSVMLHLYYDSKTKKIAKKTFSILKIVENKDFSLEVFPLEKLIDKQKNEKERNEVISNVTQIYNRFLSENKDEVMIKKEYMIK